MIKELLAVINNFVRCKMKASPCVTIKTLQHHLSFYFFGAANRHLQSFPSLSVLFTKLAYPVTIKAPHPLRPRRLCPSQVNNASRKD